MTCRVSGKKYGSIPCAPTPVEGKLPAKEPQFMKLRGTAIVSGWLAPTQKAGISPSFRDARIRAAWVAWIVISRPALPYDIHGQLLYSVGHLQPMTLTSEAGPPNPQPSGGSRA